MRILCFSDWHLSNYVIDFAVKENKEVSLTRQIKGIAEDQKPDVIVVTGDTVEHHSLKFLNAFMHWLFPDTPVIVTLGNHEFWDGDAWKQTLLETSNQTEVHDNVHILDLSPAEGVEINGFNFVGGALFFDGSMRWQDNDDITPWDGWQDFRISGIEQDYKKINRWYVRNIKKGFRKGMPNVLCTHHVPHIALNAHEPSHYSFYTGMNDLVSELPFDDAFPNALICGHTHKRIIGEVVPGFHCVNVGSTYGYLQWYLLEL